MAVNKPKILIVDDSRHTRQLFRNILEEAGYQIFDECDGVQALKFLGTHTVDLVLLDMVMPNMDGTNTLVHMRRMNCQTPVILITSIIDASVIANCMQHGVSEFVVKPINKDELIAKVGHILGHTGITTTAEIVCPTLFVGRERVAEQLGQLLPDNIHLEDSIGRAEAEAKCLDQRFERVVVGSVEPPADIPELLQKLRELQPSASFYRVYLRSEENPAAKCLEDGYDGFLLKPLSKKQITSLFDLEEEDPRPFDIEDFVIEFSAPQPGQTIKEQYVYGLESSLSGAVEALADAQFDFVVFQLTNVPLCQTMLNCLSRPVDIALDMGLEVRMVVNESQEAYLIGEKAFEDIIFHDTVEKAVIALAG